MPRVVSRRRASIMAATPGPSTRVCTATPRLCSNPAMKASEASVSCFYPCQRVGCYGSRQAMAQQCRHVCQVSLCCARRCPVDTCGGRDTAYRAQAEQQHGLFDGRDGALLAVVGRVGHPEHASAKDGMRLDQCRDLIGVRERIAQLAHQACEGAGAGADQSQRRGGLQHAGAIDLRLCGR